SSASSNSSTRACPAIRLEPPDGWRRPTSPVVETMRKLSTAMPDHLASLNGSQADLPVFAAAHERRPILPFRRVRLAATVATAAPDDGVRRRKRPGPPWEV